MNSIARKQLMTWDEVEWFYHTSFPSTIPDEKLATLRTVAAASVFWAWWNAKLDSEETPEEMCILSVLRKENPLFDQDLHDWCDRNEQEVRRKWEEKDKAKKYGGQNDQAAADNGGGDGAGWAAPPDTSGGGGGGWESAAPAASNPPGTNTWDTTDTFNDEVQPCAPPNSLASPDFHGTKNAYSAPPLPNLSEITTGNGFGSHNGGDWAEEVNEVVEDQGHQYVADQW